jgi:hypothetical protein
VATLRNRHAAEQESLKTILEKWACHATPHRCGRKQFEPGDKKVPKATSKAT